MGEPGAFDDRLTLRVTVSGDDRPGLLSTLFASLASDGPSPGARGPRAASPGALTGPTPGVVPPRRADGATPEILDVEQVVVRGHLTLGVLVRVDDDGATLTRHVRHAAERLGLRCQVDLGTGDQPHRHGSRMHVMLMGSPLLPRAVAAVTARLADRGANIDRIRRTAADPVTAVELDVSGVPDLRDLRRDLTATAAGLGVDVAVSPAGLSRHGRRLVVMDVDSTLIQDEAVELLAEHAGRAPEVAAVTARAMRGEIDFTESLHERVATLAGLPASVLAEVAGRLRLTPGAATVARTLRRLGFTLALVSGGFHEIIDPVAESLGIRHVRANRLDVADGVLTGRVLGPVVDRPAKAEALREFAAAEELPLSRTVAIGDGANDLDMLAAAGLGIAFNAKPLVREQADAAVTVPHLDTVLLILGLTREEIDEPGDPADTDPDGSTGVTSPGGGASGDGRRRAPARA